MKVDDGTLSRDQHWPGEGASNIGPRSPSVTNDIRSPHAKRGSHLAAAAPRPSLRSRGSAGEQRRAAAPGGARVVRGLAGGRIDRGAVDLRTPARRRAGVDGGAVGVVE